MNVISFDIIEVPYRMHPLDDNSMCTEAAAGSDPKLPASADLARAVAKYSREAGQLRAEIEARDAFIRIVTHELRSPMAVIYSRLELLEMTARRHRTSRQIVAGMERLRVAVDGFMHRANTLLDTARIASGKRQFQFEETDLSDLMRLVIEQYRVIAEHAHCELEVMTEAGVVGWWDRLAIEEIIENLLSNALRYGARKPVYVALLSEPNGARLVVRDQGPGISEADQRRIFAPFEQAAVATDRRGGFGIGLWVVRQLVDALHGKLEVKSRIGAGAEFTVWLPYLGGALPHSRPPD